MEKVPMSQLSFNELLALRKYFTKRRTFLMSPDIGVADKDAKEYDMLTCFIGGIDDTIYNKFFQYELDLG